MVLPGFSPTRAKFLRCSSRLMTEDFPTLDLPAKAISGRRVLGKSLGEAAEIKNYIETKYGTEVYCVEGKQEIYSYILIVE